MPLPIVLKPLLQKRAFWTAYDFWYWHPEIIPDSNGELERFPELENCTVDVPIPDGFGLSLQFLNSLFYFSLSLSSPGRDPIEIGFDDQAHWHPHVLRWNELERFCRAAALLDPDFPHPGPLLLLLARFAPICLGDDVGWIVPTLEAAWRQAGGFTAREITAAIERIDARDAGFRWQYEEAAEGWCLEQLEGGVSAHHAYTLRHVENPDFPFSAYADACLAAERVIHAAEAAGTPATHEFARTGDLALIPTIIQELRAAGQSPLAAALGEAPSLPQACWVVEVLHGLEPGTLIKRFTPSPHVLRPKHTLNLTLHLRDAERPLPSAAGKFIAETLDQLLHDLDLGRAETIGSAYTPQPDGSYVTTEYLTIDIKGDRERGLRLIRDTLRWCGAPASTELFSASRDPLPLQLAEEAVDFPEFYLQLTRLELFRWDDNRGREKYRLDRVILAVETRAAIRSVLTSAGAEGPNEDGWFTIHTSDGGSLRICFRRLDQDPGLDGGTVLIGRLSAQVSRVLYDLMSATGLWLIPVMITTGEDAPAGKELPWPPLHRASSPIALHTVLEAIPLTRWQHQGDAADRELP